MKEKLMSFIVEKYRVHHLSPDNNQSSAFSIQINASTGTETPQAAFLCCSLRQINGDNKIRGNIPLMERVTALSE